MDHSEKNFEPEEQQGVAIGDLFYKYLHFWPLFLVLVIVIVSAAWVYLRYKQPVYETKATLLIKTDNSATPDQMMQMFDMFGSQKSVENEVEVLQSKTLMQEVVRSLHLYAPIRVEGRVTSQSAYTYCPVIIEVRNPDSIKPAKKVYFKYESDRELVHIDGKSYPLFKYLTTPDGVLRFVPNPRFESSKYNNEDEDQYFYSLGKVKGVANSILSQVNIAPSSQLSTVIDLTIRGEVKEMGEDILNELLKAYNRAAILDKNALAGNTLKFVEDRLKLVSHDLDSIENSLQLFKARNKITDISAQGQIFLQSVATNDQQISDINMQLAVLDQVESYVKSNEGLGGIVPGTLGVTDPALTNLLQKLSDLELKYAQTKKIVPENNPGLAALKDGIEKLRPGILDNIQSQRKNLLAGKKDLDMTNSQYASVLRSIPEKERELLSISRQQSIKNDIYTFLLKKREETALSFASTVADSRIIDNAESLDTPVSPNKQLIYLAAFLLAIVLGVIYVYLKDAFTRSVQSRRDIESVTNVPILGEVIFDTTKSPIVISEGKRSFIAEQFRQIRTALTYMGIDENHKRILVTSSVTGEGKSFISTNLAISISLTRKKVALLELDLRKPKVSKQLGISSKNGISNFLIGKVNLSEIIMDTGFENFSLIPSGPIPPNPSELMSNGKLDELLNKLESQFDYLIIDAPPVNPVTDATILSPKCDVTMFIVRQNYTPKAFIGSIEDRSRTGKFKNQAIILNGIKINGQRRYGYGHKYGLGYGYSEDAVVHKKWWRKFF